VEFIFPGGKEKLHTDIVSHATPSCHAVVHLTKEEASAEAGVPFVVKNLIL
jgi:hypothetical protein